MRNKIMIVDKDDRNRMALNNILCTDYTILETTNAQDALRLLKQWEDEMAAILIDMLTSREDGFALLRAVHDGTWHAGIPVLVVCDASAVFLEKQLLQYGVSECISQPFDDTLIKLKVSNIVKLFQYQNELEKTIRQQTERLQMQNKMLKIQAGFGGRVTDSRETTHCISSLLQEENSRDRICNSEKELCFDHAWKEKVLKKVFTK